MGKKTPESRGCRVIRVTDSHDQTTDAGQRWLMAEIKKIPEHIPILLWGSIPCTGGSPWTGFNLRQYPDTFPARLRQLKTKWRKLTYNFYRLVDVISKRKGHWAIEWPTKCYYWESPQVKEFIDRQLVKGNLHQAVASGCAFNLRAIAGPRKGKLMSKKWLIKTSLPNVDKFLERPCSCPPEYQHASAEGQNTAHSGRYTAEFVAQVHKMFSNFVHKN